MSGSRWFRSLWPGPEAGRPPVRLGAVLFLLALAGRLLYIVWFQTYHHLGGAELERAAMNLAREGFLGNVYADGSGPSAHVAPLYPAFLSLVYQVFGANTYLGRLVQELFATGASCLGIASLPFLAHRLRLGAGPGTAAALLLAVLPVNLWVETSGSWPQPYAALALLALLWIFAGLHEEGWSSRRKAAATGILVGGIALLSPSLLAAVALLVLVEWAGQRGRRKQVVVGAALMALVSLAVISPWILRNTRTFGGVMFVRSDLGLELALGNHDGADGTSFGTSWEDPASYQARHHPYGSRRELERLEAMGERAYMREKLAAAEEWIRAHPKRFLALTLRRFRLYWVSSPELWSARDGIRAFKAVVFGSIGLAALLALAGTFFVRHRYRWLLLAALLGASSVYMVTFVDPRYRYPTFGVSAMLAMWGLAAVGARIRGREFSP